VFDKLTAELVRELLRAGSLAVLDPFAGTGRIHLLARLGISTVGVEIEPEWAAYHSRTVLGDARVLPFAARTFDAVATSPTYGNRMADHHEARDGSHRVSYRHTLGRPLSAGNSGALQWGTAYRQLHRAVWAEVVRVLRPGGLVLVNVKDHIRQGRLVAVADWHREALEALGCAVEAVEPVRTPGLRFGANHAARVADEVIIRARTRTERGSTQ
jgi:tRNA G10  N-methylase Trm11